MTEEQTRLYEAATAACLALQKSLGPITPEECFSIYDQLRDDGPEYVRDDAVFSLLVYDERRFEEEQGEEPESAG